MTTLRERWRDGSGPTYGGWCAIPSAVSAELLSRLGFDWLCVDVQHGLIDYSEMLSMVQAIAIAGTPTLVRVPWNEPGAIGRALDAGADGAIIPMVDSPEDAERAVAAARYAPAGTRSWGPIRRTLADPSWAPERANELTCCVVMLETRQAIEGVEEIVSVPGVDAIYIGTMDLSVSYGYAPLELATNPEHQGVFEGVAAACARHGVIAGAHCPDVAVAARFRELGYRMLNVAGDLRFLRQGAESTLAQLRGAERDADATPQGYA
jgi:4-hydroxy-2-oxoheptanedioate aldolase